GADGEVHPNKRRRRDGEQRHEAALPHARQIIERAEEYRQHEAAQAPNQADDTADRTHVLRIVDGDVFVDGRLAETHEETEDEDEHGESDEAGLQAEAHGPADTL